MSIAVKEDVYAEFSSYKKRIPSNSIITVRQNIACRQTDRESVVCKGLR